MKDEIRYNLIYRILQEELMELIILKPCGFLYFRYFYYYYYDYLVFKFMLIVELEEFTFQIDCIRKKNYHQNLSFFYLIRLY